MFGWLTRLVETWYMIAAYSLIKMGYDKERVYEALDVLFYGNLGLLWRRFKERRLKWK